MLHLTDKHVRTLAPGLTAVRRWDGGGLYFEVLPKGARRWIFKYTHHGKERRMSLGPYPAVSLKDARQRRDDARRLLRDGRDPIRERQDARRAAEQAHQATLRVVADEWIAAHGSWTGAYRQDVRGAFERYVFPAIGDRPIRDITTKVLQLEIIKPLTDRGRMETARRIRQRLELLWNHAILTERAAGNPALPLKGTIDRPAAQHFGSVAEADLPQLLVSVRAYGNRLVEHAVLLQVLTATRPGETRGAAWSEFDLEAGLWTIPAARMKRGDERGDHLVPLSRQALAVLRALHVFTGAGPVLFPSRSRLDVPMSEGAVLMVFERVGFGHVTAHGFRSLFSTLCHEHGQESHLIELSLAHVDRNTIRATYNKALYLPQRRTLLQWWGDHVEALCAAHTGAHGLLPILETSDADHADASSLVEA